MSTIWPQRKGAIRLHSSVHDDEPCLCIDCRNLRAAIQRNAAAQPMQLRRR
ncbi:MAG: hypothetical protein O2972_07520 [Cyanobacteria bacterium]|nr:hypothetical protein [Cyanobacteriota bacterium]